MRSSRSSRHQLMHLTPLPTFQVLIWWRMASVHLGFVVFLSPLKVPFGVYFQCTTGGWTQDVSLPTGADSIPDITFKSDFDAGAHVRMQQITRIFSFPNRF